MIRKNKKIMAFLLAIQSLAFFSAVEVNAEVLKGTAAQSGEINNASAYKDGSFYIEGNIEGRGSSACYLKNGTYSNLKNVAYNIDISNYGSKYVEIHGGDYYLDMSNGTLSSSGLKKKENSDAASKLNENLKNDNIDRYRKEELNNVRTLKELPKNKFSEGWYESRYSVKETSTSINNGADDSVVYSDSKGNYIDADYSIGSMKVQLTNGKTAEIKNTHDKVEETRAAIARTEVIGQDSKNIYRLAEITLKCDEVGVGIKSVNGIDVNTGNCVFQIGDNGTSIVVDVIQSISKEAAAERTGGIKYSKKVINYVLGNSSGQATALLNNTKDGFSLSNGKLINYSCNQVTLQAEVLELKSKGAYSYIEKKSTASLKVNKGKSSIDLDASGNLWALSGKNLYEFNVNKGFEQVYELDNQYTDLSAYDNKNIAVWNKEGRIYSTIGGKTVKSQSADVKTVESTSEDSELSQKAESQDSSAETKERSSAAETADKNENTQVSSSDNEKNDKTDKTDNSKNNEKDAAATAEQKNSQKEGNAESKSDAAQSTNNADSSKAEKNDSVKVDESTSSDKTSEDTNKDDEKKGWVESSSGRWNYVEEGGKNHVGWLELGSKWYFMDESGFMITGWKEINNKWYYFGDNGEMKTKWQQINGDWYYFSSNGEMLSHTIVEGNILGFDGKMLKL